MSPQPDNRHYVRRVVLPSGKTIEVVYFDDQVVDAPVAEPAAGTVSETVHDLHVWTVSDGMNYLSCHVELPQGSSIEEVSMVVQQLNRLLSHEFGIAHATIQAEVAGTCVSDCLDAPRLCQDTTIRQAP